MLFDYTKLDSLDLLRAGALGIGFFVAIFADKKSESRNFQTAHAILLFLTGLGSYFFPALLLDYQTDGSLDSRHLYLMQVVGAIMIGTGVVVYRSRESRDPQVKRSWLLTTILGGILLLELQIYTKSSLEKADKKLNDQHLSFAGFANTLVVLGALYKLWGSFSDASSRVTRRQAANLNGHVIISLLLSFSGGIIDLIAPDYIYSMMGKTPDGIHLYLVRMVGGFALSYAIMLLLSLQYEADDDRRDLFLGILVAGSLIIATGVVTQYKLQLYSKQQFAFALGGQAVQLGNAACAAWIVGKDKKY